MVSWNQDSTDFSSMDFLICRAQGTLIWAVIMATFGAAKRTCIPARLVEWDALNMNITVSWAPPPNIVPNDTNVLYTVKHREARRLTSFIEAVNCVNITHQICSLSPNSLTISKIPLEHKVAVFATLPSGKELKYCDIKMYPLNANISAPEIPLKRVNKTARYLIIALKSPLTPYFNIKQLRMTNRMLRFKGKFNYTLEANGQEIDKGEKDYDPDADETLLTLDDLTPFTNYVLYVQSSNSKTSEYSHDTRRIEINTLQEAPENSPKTPSVLDIQVNCDRPNTRDIEITWRPPAKETWNINLTKYEVHYISDISSSPHSLIIPTMDTSNDISEKYTAEVPGLSRWQNYTLWVSAHNAAGSSSSDRILIPVSTIDTKTSEPLKVSADATALNNIRVSWEPPTSKSFHNDDAACVSGYIVQIHPWSHVGDNSEEESNDIVHIEVQNRTSYDIIDMKRGIYAVKVSSAVHAGLNKTTKGETATIKFDFTEGEDSLPTWIVPVAVALLLTLTAGIVVAVAHRNCFYRLITDDTLENNKILAKARSVKPLLPFSHQNNEIIDDVSRYIPVRPEVQEGHLTRNSESTFFNNPSTQHQTPPTSPCMPGTVDIVDMFDQTDPLTTQSCARSSGRSFRHLYTNVNRPKVPKELSAAKALENGASASELTSHSEIREHGLGKDCNIREEISPYSNISDTKNKYGLKDHTTHTLTESSEEVAKYGHQHLAEEIQSPCEFPDSSYLNTKETQDQDKSKQYLNNNTLVIPTPCLSDDHIVSSDIDLELTTLDYSDNFREAPIPDFSKPDAVVVDANIEPYTTLDKLGLSSCSDDHESQPKCPFYVQHTPQSTENTSFVLSDKEEQHYKINPKDGSQSILSIDYCPHDQFHFPTLSLKTSPTDLVESDTETDFHDITAETDCFVPMPSVCAQVASETALPDHADMDMAYTKFADLPLLLPEI